MDERKPLNGTKTHALKPSARAGLEWLLSGPRPTQSFNPGVVDRLRRGEYVRVVQLASPFKSHKGRPIAHLEITDAGRMEIDHG